MKISIDPSVFALFPELSVQGLIVLNLQDQNQIAALDTSALKIAPERAKDVVKQWKEAYKTFPSHKKARPSIEYLTWALEKEKLRKISPLVDLYNHASLLSLSPFGGEDIDKINGALTLGIASGTEPFVPLGGSEVEYPSAGEIVWVDGVSKVVCRALNWLESDLHKLTEPSKNIVFVSERASNAFPDPDVGFKLLNTHLAGLGAELIPFKLDKNQTEVTI